METFAIEQYENDMTQLESQLSFKALELDL
jgi:hypothetical protein